MFLQANVIKINVREFFYLARSIFSLEARSTFVCESSVRKYYSSLNHFSLSPFFAYHSLKCGAANFGNLLEYISKTTCPSYPLYLLPSL
jgi:hypothetical protein